MDADQNIRLETIDDFSSLVLTNLESEYSTFNFAIEVETDPPVVGSIRFTDNVGVGVPLENTAPYALGGDNAGDFFVLNLTAGDWTVSAEPFCLPDAQGGSGPVSTREFVVVA